MVSSHGLKIHLCPELFGPETKEWTRLSISSHRASKSLALFPLEITSDAGFKEGGVTIHRAPASQARVVPTRSERRFREPTNELTMG